MHHARTALACLLAACCVARAPADSEPASDPLTVEGTAAIAPEPGAQRTITLRLTNPAPEPAELIVRLETQPGWRTEPHAARVRLDPSGTADLTFTVTAPALGPLRPELHARAERTDAPPHAEPLARIPVPVEPALPPPDPDAPNAHLRLDGASAVRVDPPTHPERFTLEAWVRADAPARRAAVVSNTESSGFALFWSDGDPAARQPSAFVHAGDGYARVAADRPWAFNRWTHIALTFDGRRARLFIDGRPADTAETDAPGTPNDLPIFIGADTDADARPLSFWKGDVDEVRLSRVIRYDDAFTPQRRLRPDADTVLLFNFDEDLGPLFRDASPNAGHAWAVGRPAVVRDAD